MQDAHLAFTGYAGKRLHLGISGSISAYKAADLSRMWMRAGVPVGVTLTEAGARFISALTFSALGAQPVLTAMFSDGAGPLDSQEVFGHLLPGQAAQAMIIAPATAAVLARIARGMADDLLACQALAFDGPLIVAPAMNPRMWANSATQENIDILRSRGISVIVPGHGSTACLEEGQGRLADVRHIFLHGLRALTPQSLAGKTAMLTIGPTAEPWDGVRVWTNRSSGIMGASLALALWLHGADVIAVCGPGVPWLPPEVDRIDIETASEMFDAAEAAFQRSDIAAFTAAVADFRPEQLGGAKFKKSDASEGFSVNFLPNRDILGTLSRQKRPGQRIIGFAVETDDLFGNMQRKLEAKNADLLVGNLAGQPDAAFGAPTNRVTLLANGEHEELPLLSKPDVARRIVEWLLRL